MSCTIIVGVAVARRSVSVPVNVVVPTGGGGAAQPTSLTYTNQTSVHVMHNRGYRPLVAVYDSFGDQVIATVSQNSINDFFVNFSTPSSGTISYL